MLLQKTKKKLLIIGGEVVSRLPKVSPEETEAGWGSQD